MRPFFIEIDTYAAADADAVALSQTPAAGGIQALDLAGAAFVSGNVATMDTPRQVVIASDANDTARTFVVRGTRSNGASILEAIAGPNIGNVSTIQAFATVTEILVDDDTAGAITAGTATVIQSNWAMMDYITDPGTVALGIDVGAATPDLSVQVALGKLGWRGNDARPAIGSHVGSDFKRVFPSVKAYNHDTLVNVTADQTGNLAFPVTAIRLQSNAALASGPVKLEVVQAGHTGA